MKVTVRTRKGLPKPKSPKNWFSRVVRRELAVNVSRIGESAKAQNAREERRAVKRNHRRRCWLKAARLRVQAEDNYRRALQERTARRSRDARGRFKPKRPVRSRSRVK